MRAGRSDRRGDRAIAYARSLDGTRLRAVLLVGLVVVAYAYSLATLLRAATLGSPAGLLAVVPVVVLLLTWGRLRREAPAPNIHDRQVDYIIGIGLILAALAFAVLLPGSQSNQFWLARLDLLGAPLFAGGLIALFYGVRRVWSLRWPLAALLLVWPGLWGPLLDLPGSGSVAVVAVLLLIVGLGGVLRGRRAARVTWALATLLMLGVLVALATLLPGGGVSGFDAAGLAAAWLAILPIAVTMLLSILLARVLGLRLGDGRNPRTSPASPNPVRRLGWAPVVATAAAVALALVNVGYQRYGLVMDEAGNPTRTAFSADRAAPAGWEVLEGTEAPGGAPDVPRPFLAEGVELERALLVPAGGTQPASGGLILDVVSGPDAGAVAADAVDGTYGLPRDETLTRSSVDVGAGAPAQLRTYVNQRLGTTRTVIAWDWPVRVGDGTRYERIALIAPDVTGSTSRTASVATGAADGEGEGHKAVERLLVELARQLVQSDANGTPGTAGAAE